jgi:hypothetical protein
VLDITRQRGDTATACPSEVARALSENWRALMPRVRDAASRFARQGLIEITQRGAVVSAAGPWKGPIRIRKPRS